MELEPKTTVAQLLERSLRERAQLAALWDGLDAQQLTQRPGPQADWSVKDLIAHISWWEQEMCQLTRRILAGERITIDGTVEQANAQSFAQQRDSSLSDVLAGFAASGQELARLLGSLRDEQINDESQFAFYGKPLRHFIAANTYRHYGDHSERLRSYRARQLAAAG